jgi:uncharacterized membrane protein YdjX (TVP38/TMEM64 family)
MSGAQLTDSAFTSYSTMNPMYDQDAESDNEGDMIALQDSRSCVSRHWKKLAVASVVLALLACLVVDLVSKTCTTSESQADSRARMVCQRAALSDEERSTARNVSLTEVNPFCTVLASDDERISLKFDTRTQECTEQSACSASFLNSFLGWITENPGIGAVVTALVYMVATVLFVPGSILTLGAGAAFTSALGTGVGLVVGSLSVLVGANAGALLAFLIARFVLRSQVEEWATKYKALAAFDSVLEEQGFFIVLLLRFSPLIPFAAFNYVMGVTAVGTRGYALGTVLGIIPGTVAYVFVGGAVATATQNVSSGGSGTSCDTSQDTVGTVLLVVGSIATVLATVLITHYARKKLKATVKFEPDELSAHGGDETATVDA